MKRKKSLVIDGKKFPLPRSISKQIFYDSFIFPTGGFVSRRFDFSDGSLKRFIEEGRAVRTDGVYKYLRLPSSVKTERIYRRSALSCMVGEFARVRYLEDFARKLRADSEALSNSLDRERIQKVLYDEKSSLEDRVKVAKKYYLTALKKQKYG